MGKYFFRSLYESRAYMLASELRNRGFAPDLQLGRSPSGKWIHSGIVKCECDSASWDAALEAMYVRVQAKGPTP